MTAGALAIGASVVAAPAANAAVIYLDTPVPGLRTDGIVRAVDVVGTTAYLGGQFTSVTGSNGTFSRANAAAIDLVTRQVTGFAPNPNAAVYAIKATPATVYLGGDFTTVNGVSRKRLAALDPSGARKAAFVGGQPSGRVRTIEIVGSQLWVGGGFDYVSSLPRSAAAVVNATSGAVSPITLNADKSVRTIKAAPDGSVVYIGGDFATIAGSARNYLAVATPDGTITPTTFPSLLPTGDNLVLALAVDPSRNLIYGGIGGVKGVGLGNQVVAWNPTTGQRVWTQITDGDVQAISVYENTVYFGFHEGFGGDATLRLLAANATTGALVNTFRPTVNSFYGVWALNAGPLGLVAGGEFTTVSGVDTRRFAYFGLSSATPVTLVSPQRSWHYSDTGTLADSSWTGESFDDSAWKNGLPQFGYGDGDENTVISYGPSTTRKYITSYFRTTFDLAGDPSEYSDLFASMVVDDGAVLYVNGVEVSRDNMPAGAIAGSTLASTARDGAYESSSRSFAVPTSLLHTGTNTISVEVHQATAGSSDLSFALTVDGIHTAP